MKPLFISAIIALTLLACHDQSTPASEAKTASSSTDMKAVYEKNLATLKAAVAAFEKEDVEQFASNYADSAKFHPPVYGMPDGGKKDLKNYVSAFFANWDSIKLVQSNFLPGLDSATHEMDGSARYYGVWSAVNKNGYKGKVKVYEAFDFNKDNKIIDVDGYYDAGGVMNAVNNFANKK